MGFVLSAVPNPTDLDWWWQYGLDGVVGGIIGGAVTGVAVWLTLRHERRMAEDADLRRAAGALQATALSVILFRATDDEEEWNTWRNQMFHDAVVLRDVADSSSPTLARDAAELLKHLDTVVNDELLDVAAASATGAAVNERLSQWRQDRRGYEQCPPMDWSTDVAERVEARLKAKAKEAAERAAAEAPDETGIVSSN